MAANGRIKNNHLDLLQGRLKLRKSSDTRNRLYKELVKFLIFLKAFYFFCSELYSLERHHEILCKYRNSNVKKSVLGEFTGN